MLSICIFHQGNSYLLPLHFSWPLFWSFLSYWFTVALGRFWAFRIAQLVKNLPAMLETWVWFLGWEDCLEKEMATHSHILAWKIPRREKPGGLHTVHRSQVGHDLVLSFFLFQFLLPLILSRCSSCFCFAILLFVFYLYDVPITTMWQPPWYLLEDKCQQK